MEEKKQLILIEDTCTPEDNAMLQALYSRSAASVTEHLEKVKKAGSGKFMESFYVGYGHGSIGDCGSTTIFIENVSILAAKAIQDWRLYNGQETSTRYIDMAKQPIRDPLNTNESKEIIKAWMDFYISSQEKVKEHLRATHPRLENEEEKTYERAVNARVFDILRAFLPAGIATQLSWHTNLRQAADRLALLRHHPLSEVKNIAEEILTKLKEKYPSSFSHKLYESQEAYRDELSKDYSYYLNSQSPVFAFKTNINSEDLKPFEKILSERPIKTNLPSFLDELGGCWCDYLIDFGSSRDLQRHRNGVFRMPLATTKFGFHQWYLDQLPAVLKTEAEKLIAQQTERIEKLSCDDETKQYFVSLGYLVSCRMYFSLPGLLYMIELRSDTTVHPTIRPIMAKIDHELSQRFPKLALHTNLNESDWDIRRGKQTIEQK
jgi:thymidylate synthase ThyX